MERRIGGWWGIDGNETGWLLGSQELHMACLGGEGAFECMAFSPVCEAP